MEPKNSGHFEPYKDIVWNQALADQYNVAELVLKNIVKQNWNNMPYDWSFSADNLNNRAAYIDVQNEAMHELGENITFSAGTEVSKTIESAKGSTTKFAGTSFFKLDTKGGLLFHFERKRIHCTLRDRIRHKSCRAQKQNYLRNLMSR